MLVSRFWLYNISVSLPISIITIILNPWLNFNVILYLLFGSCITLELSLMLYVEYINVISCLEYNNMELSLFVFTPGVALGVILGIKLYYLYYITYTI